MFRFIVAVLLINSYSGSWGAPTKNSTMLSESLKVLANSCQNPFLSTQMINKIKDCNVPVPPYQEKQLECLLFYDINRQLCEAVASSKFTLNEDYTPKILEKQDVSELCSAAKDWIFTDMGEVYKKAVKVVFHDLAKCSKVCSVESDDILSVDSTFYCKYFNWGSNMLKSRVSAITANAVVPAQGPNDIVVNTSNTAADILAASIKIDNKTETSFNNANAPTPKQSNGQETKSTVDKTVPSNVVNLETVAQLSSKNKADEVAPSDVQKPEATDKDKITEAHAVILPAETVSTNEAQQQVNQKDNVPKNETTSIESKIVVDNSKKDATPDNVKKDSASPDLLNQLENPKPKDVADLDDYPGNDIDSDEKDGLTDTQGGDDIDDPSLADLETKHDQDLNKKPVKNSELPVYNNDISPKEIYPNTIPDGFAEDDDHFFPFFLTAIIMVVLLYILYHNKNKVSKVFLGLIVEGRQPGRRRNSRGHAYRRLDTLEQAMSANTAAPPSKIIY